MKISDEIREFVCNEDLFPSQTDELRCIADRIDRELVELPKCNDGVPIHVRDTLYDVNSGSQMQVRSMTIDRSWIITTDGWCTYAPSNVTHTRPDSLGRIADDIKAVEERQGEDNEWRADAVFVSESTLREWEDRIRRLAEREDE